MEPSKTSHVKNAARRVWTLRRRDGKEMKFEVSLVNPKMAQAQDTIRRLMSECPDVQVLEQDE